jgi:hypothetical protein
MKEKSNFYVSFEGFSEDENIIKRLFDNSTQLLSPLSRKNLPITRKFEPKIEVCGIMYHV